MEKNCMVQMDDGILCGRAVYTKSMCSLHYARRRKGIPMGQPIANQAKLPAICSLCSGSIYAKGLCAAHYHRERLDRSVRGRIRYWNQTDIEKVSAIIAEAIPFGDCLHAAEIGHDGYATSVKDEQGKGIKTHRLVYRVMKGDPGGLQVHHACANRACINPDHLVLATQLQNVAEMHARKTYEARITALEAEIARLQERAQ